MLACKDTASVTALLPRAFGVLLGPNTGALRVERELPKLTRFGSPPVFSFSPTEELARQLRREGYDQFRYFVALPSRRTPRWLLPFERTSGMLRGTEIYVPHRWLPRTLKRMLVRLTKLGCTSWLRPGILLASKGPLWLEALVRAVVGEPQPIFALSFGRQAAVRKLTVQVMRTPDKQPNNGQRQTAHEILGYMKIPLTDLSVSRVRHEAATLERLWNFSALKKHIPRVLYAGNWNETFVLFQSPLDGNLGPTRLNGIHTEFLGTLGSVHRVERPGQALIDKVGANWEKVAPMLGAPWQELGCEVLARATRAIGDKMLPFVVTHGDFAPWNTRVGPTKELLLFDWESADWEAPTTWDAAHFEVLTASSSLRKTREYQVADVPSGGATFMLYLLNSVYQYVQEGNHEAVRFRRELLIRQLQRN